MNYAQAGAQAISKKIRSKVSGIYYFDELSPEQVLEHGKRFWILGKEYQFNECGVKQLGSSQGSYPSNFKGKM